MVNLILFGPPGSGKGTQAAKLVEKYNLLHISTGDLFRSEIKNETALGLKAKHIMTTGELVPDEITVGMLRNKVLANPDVEGYIFDGFPRTIPQCEALNQLLSENSEEVTLLIELEVEDEEIVKRLLHRAKTSGRADDADESIIKNRLEVYKAETVPVSDFYDKLGKTVRVHGQGTIDEVFSRLSNEIDSTIVC